MEKQVNELQTRQLELLSIMAKSDAHASKCVKLGLIYADEYPEELGEYESARAEYVANEQAIAELEALPDEEIDAIL